MKPFLYILDLGFRIWEYQPRNRKKILLLVAILGAVLLLPATAQNPHVDRNQQAVRVLTREVALRVFGEFAKEKDPKTKQLAYFATPAKRIADSLRKYQDADALTVIAAIDKKQDLEGAKNKLTELARFVPENTKPDNEVLAVLKNRLIVWRKKYQSEHKAYQANTIQEAAVIETVGAWLVNNPSPTDPNQATEADTTTNQANQQTDLQEDKSDTKDSKTQSFPWVWFLGGLALGLVLAASAAFWFWYRPKQKLDEQWQTVGDNIKTLNIPGVSFRKSTPTDTEITSLIETLYNRAKDNGYAETQGQPQTHRAELLAKIKAELGEGDLIAKLRGLKEEVLFLRKEMKLLLYGGEAKSATQPPKQPPTTTGQNPAKTGNAGNGSANQQPQSVIVFFAQPNPEGVFDNDQRTNQPTPDSCYRFSLPTATANTATFRFAGNANDMPRFLNFRHVFIDPACESQNNYQPGHSRIVTLNDGKADFVNGEWRVNTKAKIRFE
jgi:hypothetical protein